MKDLTEAQAKYAKHILKDPFPTISPALLNSEDIRKYCEEFGMIYPFNVKQLKPATYALTVGGKYCYWDKNKNIQSGDLKKGECLTIKKNSIVFITLEEQIQLPHYIAARFNLKISNIYKGLLLGTGPMIDPGFSGKLSIPLHNLTSNSYTITGGDTFIWMEFTKLSYHPQWDSYDKLSEDQSKLKFFNTTLIDKNVDNYLKEADGRSVQSSIPLSITRSETAARKAANKAQLATIISSAVNFALVITVMVFVYNVWKGFPDFKEASANSLDEIKRLHIQDSIERNKLQDSILNLSNQVRKILSHE